MTARQKALMPSHARGAFAVEKVRQKAFPYKFEHI